MTTKDPIREAFKKWALNNSTSVLVDNDFTDKHISTLLKIEIKAFRAALSLIPHAAEILSGEAEVVLKKTKPCA